MLIAFIFNLFDIVIIANIFVGGFDYYYIIFMITFSIYVWFIEESRLLKPINNYFRVNPINTKLKKRNNA